MNTAELAERVASEHDLGKGQAKALVEAVLSAIVEADKSGEEVSLSGFGRFKVSERPARQGRGGKDVMERRPRRHWEGDRYEIEHSHGGGRVAGARAGAW